MATFSSLPPEIVLHILKHLPRPAIRGTGWQRSPLLNTALVDRRLGTMAQRLLFERVRVRDYEQLRTWSITKARSQTVELSISLSWRTAKEAGVLGDHPLERILLAGLRGKEGTSGGRKLRILEIGFLKLQNLGDKLVRNDGLEALESLSTSDDFIPGLPPGTLHNLTHLRLSDYLTTLPLARFPHLTHLTFKSSSRTMPNLALACPRLIYLELKSSSYDGSDSLPTLHLPLSLTHFATRLRLTAGICDALPDRLMNLALGCQTGHDFGSVRRRWCEAGGVPRLSTFTLRKYFDDGRADAMSPLPLEERRRVEAELKAMREAGCAVEFRRWTDTEWRGE